MISTSDLLQNATPKDSKLSAKGSTHLTEREKRVVSSFQLENKIIQLFKDNSNKIDEGSNTETTDESSLTSSIDRITPFMFRLNT